MTANASKARNKAPESQNSDCRDEKIENENSTAVLFLRNTGHQRQQLHNFHNIVRKNDLKVKLYSRQKLSNCQNRKIFSNMWGWLSCLPES